MENKYPIGSQWRTRGGKRAVIVDKTKINLIVWHNMDQNDIHELDGTCRGFNEFDLMEPWVEKRSGNGFINIYEGWIGHTVKNTDEQAEIYRNRKRLARIKIEWTEGQFDE